MLPAVELHSVLIGLHETDITSCEIYGEVRVQDGAGLVDFYKVDKESSNSRTVLPDSTLCLMGPSRCIVGTWYRFTVFLKDKQSGLEISNGLYRSYPDPRDGWYDKPLRVLIPGKHGFAVLHYSLLKNAVQANLEVRLLTDNGAPEKKEKKINESGEHHSSQHLVYGTMYARYGNYDTEYPGEFSSKYYRSTLLYASSGRPKKLGVTQGDDGPTEDGPEGDDGPTEDGPQGADGPTEERGHLIPLSRRVVGVPELSNLIIEAVLWDTYYGVSETRDPDVRGTVSFFAESEASAPTTGIIKGENCDVEVKVKWIGNPFIEHYGEKIRWTYPDEEA